MSVVSRTATQAQTKWATRMLGSGLLAAALLTSVTATGANAAGVSGVGVEGYPAPQVAAITASGLVRITTEWSGSVQYDANFGPVRSEPITASATCSGFVADSTGYVVTAGHCVDPEEGRLALIHELVAGLANVGTITAAEAAAVTPHAVQSWVAEGATAGSPIHGQISVSRTTVPSGGSPAGLTASVLELRPVEQGDVALLKVQTGTPLPALRVARAESEVGAQIALMGYPSGSDGAVDPGLAPTFISGRTSARQSSNGLPFLQLDAAVPGMSGGPVVDLSGDVVGIVSAAPFPPTDGFIFATAAETITSLLDRNGVDRTLTESDRLFRSGLTSYFDGDLDAAAASFDQVLAAIPDHRGALEFRSKAAQSLTNQAGNRVGGNKSSDAPPVSGAHHVPDERSTAAPASVEVPWYIWCSGIVLVLLAVLFLAARWLRARSNRSDHPRAKITPVQNAVLAASRSGYAAPIAGRGVEASRALPVRTGNSTAARQAGAPRNAGAGNAIARNAIAPRFIPADMIRTTVPPDLMRTTVCPELLQTTVMR